MIGYTTVGVNDLAKAEQFYTAVFAELGAKLAMGMDRMKLFGTGPGAPMFGICLPYDGKPASAGNGTMIAIQCDTTAKVDAAYAKARELGAADEGEPGQRGPGFYGAYFRDADGNKVCFFKMG
jgi:catechol 2,3-dioxygenase-like lactoylglutathione lyase family enzyme